MKNTQFSTKRYPLFLFLAVTVLFCYGKNSVFAQETLPQNTPVIQFFADNKTFATIPQETFAQWFDVHGKVIFDDSYRSELELSTLAMPCPTKHPLCALLISSRTQNHARKINHISARTHDIQRFLQRLAEDVHQDPIDARFLVQNNRVTTFVQSHDGYDLDIDSSMNIIAQYAHAVSTNHYPDKIKLATKIVHPHITQATDATNLGIIELIGQGKSSFAGSPRNRIHNIHVAAAKFNGILLAPNEELSFVNILGPVDGTTGYKPELVIRDHQTKPEYGGGICQVSTTLFRAAVYGGFEITERRNHSYPVAYYKPTGFDATVYIPRPDLRFKNNTGHHILIQNHFEGTDLIFSIYGTNDGRKVEMEGPFVTERNPNGSMKTYFTQKVTDAKGNLIIDDIFSSHYKSPRDYPHPGNIAHTPLTHKPKNWSKKQWRDYLKNR